MPELPEVEFARQCLRGWAQGRHLIAIEGLDEVSSDEATARGLAALVQKRAPFARFERHGKNLFLGFENEDASSPESVTWIWSHLGMTGKWLLREKGEAAPRFSRARFALDDGHVLHFCDLRRFGSLELLSDEQRRTRPSLASLGPDLLARDLTAARLAAAMRDRKIPIKPLLLDQTLVAGVGNIHASEGVFRARLDPRQRPSTLAEHDFRALLDGLRASCKRALTAFDRAAKRGAEITYIEEDASANPFLVYGREGEPCPRCETALVRFVQAGRSTFACPHCQMGGATPARAARASKSKVKAVRGLPTPKGDTRRPKSTKQPPRRKRQAKAPAPRGTSKAFTSARGTKRTVAKRRQALS